MMDIAESKTFKNAIVLNNGLLYLIKLYKTTMPLVPKVEIWVKKNSIKKFNFDLNEIKLNYPGIVSLQLYAARFSCSSGLSGVEEKF